MASKLSQNQIREQVLMTNRFLETLRRNKKKWQNNKEFVKIVEKMQNGKNLKREEFSKVQWLFWEIGHSYV
jgi:hypothetical protein